MRKIIIYLKKQNMSEAQALSFAWKLALVGGVIAGLIIWIAVTIYKKNEYKKQLKNLEKAFYRATTDLGLYRTLFGTIDVFSPREVEAQLMKMIFDNPPYDQIHNLDRSYLKPFLKHLQAILFERFVFNLPNEAESFDLYVNFDGKPRFSPLEDIGFNAESSAIQEKVMAIWVKRLNACKSPAEMQELFLQITELSKKDPIPCFYFRPSALDNQENLLEYRWFQIFQTHLDLKTKIYLNGYQGEMNMLCLRPKESLAKIFEACNEANSLVSSHLFGFDTKTDFKNQLIEIFDHAILAIGQSVPGLNSNETKQYSELLKMREVLEDKKQTV
jgi:hypothetical protein